MHNINEQLLKWLIKAEVRRVIKEQGGVPAAAPGTPTDPAGLPPADPTSGTLPNRGEGEEETKEEEESPIDVIVKAVQQEVEKTDDTQVLVGFTKKAIQDIFGNFKQAADVANALVKAGTDEKNKTLADVGNALNRFLLSRP